MTFAHPLALLFGLLAVPVVVLYRLRTRWRREPVATNMFWERVFAERPAREKWQARRHTVSLIAQLAILALAVLAAAEPQIPRPERIVLVIDNSAGMNATDVAPGRLAAAQDAANRLVDGMHYYDQTAILTAGEAPAVRSSLTNRREALVEAIQAVSATTGPVRLREAVTLAKGMLQEGSGPRDRIIVISDGCSPETANAIKQDAELFRVGTRAANAGITALAARRTPTKPAVCQVFIAAQSHADHPAEGRISLTLDGKAVTSEPIRVRWSRDGYWQTLVETTAVAGGRLVARLDPGDAYPADNQAETLIVPMTRHHVTLASETKEITAEPSLASILRANPLVDLTTAAEPPAGGPRGGVLVLEGRVPQALPPGPILTLNPSSDCDLWRLGEPLADPTVARVAADSPIVADVEMLDACLLEARRLELSEAAKAKAQPLLWTVDGTPLAYAIERSGGRLVVLCGNPLIGNPVQAAAFPAFVANALDWLAGQGGTVEGPYHNVSCGAGVSPAIPGSRDGCTTIDLRVPADIGVDASALAAGRPWPPVWLYPAGLAVLLLVVEWCLYQRRWMS